MNHKLRVLVRVDVDPGHVTLEVTGCVTQSDSGTLMHIVRRAGRLGAGVDVVVDLHGASHLDPEVLLDLRRLAEAGSQRGPDAGDTAAPGPTAQFRLVLDEPAELPICLLHVGADGEVLAGLDAEIRQISPGVGRPGEPARPLAGGMLNVGILDAGREEANNPLAAEISGADDYELINGLALPDYFEGTLDPAATVRALSDTALCQLADALYRHLDTPTPSFGAHTWYELAAEELQNRHLTDAGGPAGDELAAGTGPAEDELAAGTALA